MHIAYSEEYYSASTPVSCDVVPEKLFAVYTKTGYNCSSGYYLPADAESCQLCPSDGLCAGGTYEYDADKFQGLVLNNPISTNTITNICADNFPTAFHAIYTINTYNCSAGYYLPADTEGCTICPENNYCPGGTYTFNETNTQGITHCPPEHPYAPHGMWQASQCGRKMHLGNEIIYLHQSPAHPTTHRFFASYNNGTNYSANTIVRNMNSNNFPKMSDGMTHGFHININGVEYLICDDSVPECRNN